jgi:5'-deoxynucleotidase YfbR-like HD superfamily hydrolase
MRVESEKRRGDWILTFTRRKFWPLDPRPDDIDVRDVAHSLARICRFGGHVVPEHYSVAQHSVLAAENIHLLFEKRGQMMPSVAPYCALLHDAAEAYPPGDLLRPLKHSQDPGVEYLLRVQDRIDNAVRTHFGLPGRFPIEVAEIDRAMLVTETRDIRGGFHKDEKYQPPAYQPVPDLTIEPWSATEAEERFLEAYEDLRRFRQGVVPAPGKDDSGSTT